MNKLPDMTVEKDDRVDTAHGLVPPAEVGSDDYEKQLSDMIELCQGAKINTTANNPAWSDRVVEILDEYAPFDMPVRLDETMIEFGFLSWAECVDFVMNDNCDDFAGLVLVYTQKLKLPHTKNRGFIDGDGIGYKRRYLERLGRKTANNRGTLEKAFDAKYHFRHPRPLVDLHMRLGDKAANCIVNYVHPAHWAYPAGHGAKFFEVVDLARDTWEMSEKVDNTILTAAYVLAMARSGGGVHFPRDNAASGYLAGLKEFAEYGS